MKSVCYAVVLGAALALACASNPPAGHAQDGKPAERTPEPRKEQEPPPRAPTTAVVEDQYGIQAEFTDLSFELPQSGIMGGGRAKKITALEYWVGAFRQKVEVADLVKVEVTGQPEGDLVPVRITRKGGKVVENAKIERELEVKGKVDGAVTSIRFERLKSLTMRQ
jgi:hypothetical protein